MPANASDHAWMARALRLARQGYYSTHPNPRVGCVIVRDNALIAEGFHAYPGGPHAEINALAQLEGDAHDATVYVTLEPCSHTGKTPPCVDALIRARPKRVVIAMQDPNPLVSGQGIARLQSQGIEVSTGILQAQAEGLNRGFIQRMLEKRPYLRVKMAMSLDGGTALANGLSAWITGAEARHDVQLHRAASSAVLSSAATVMADNPSLNVRLDNDQLQQMVPVRQPVRVIVDSKLQLSGQEDLFSIPGEIWIFTGVWDEKKYARFDANQVRVFHVDSLSDGRIDLDAMMRKLAELEINEVHTECGATLAGALIQQKLVDELVIYMAPSLLGNQARGLFDLGEISIMSDKVQLRVTDVRSIGDDIRITAKPR